MMLKSRVCVLALMLGVSGFAGQAQAQACQETQFSASNSELYMTAETELLTNKNAAGALVGLDRLLSQPLNCYEEGAALRLGAVIKIELQNYASAARDLETALSKGYIPEWGVVEIYYNLSQLYLRLENTPRSLEFYDKWLAAGGAPTPEQKWTLAVLKAQMGRYDDAITLAEAVLASQGATPGVEVQDFLVTVYGQTGKYQKQAALLQQMVTALRTETAAPAVPATPAAPTKPPKEIKLMAPPGSTKAAPPPTVVNPGDGEAAAQENLPVPVEVPVPTGTTLVAPPGSTKALPDPLPPVTAAAVPSVPVPATQTAEQAEAAEAEAAYQAKLEAKADRDVDPISPPVPSYPARAAARGIEGSCDVFLDVDPTGKPINIKAVCTDTVFKRSAERALSRVRFEPKIVAGKAVQREGVMYPMSYRLAK